MDWIVVDGKYPELDLLGARPALTSPIPTAYMAMRQSYPYIPDSPEAIHLHIPYYISTYMYVDASKNSGYPHLPDLGVPLHYVPPVKRPELIQVYDMKTPQRDFVKNGLRVLNPTKCDVYETERGRYDVQIETPIDELGAWKQVREQNIIKVMGQLFRIKSIDQTHRSGASNISAYAQHISYDLADGWITSAELFVRSAQDAINGLVSATDFAGNEHALNYNFNITSPLVGTKSFAFYDVTLSKALFDSTGTSLVDVINAEMKRDNFDISFNRRMEGAIDNAFEIRVGLNEKGLKRTIDYSKHVTNLTVKSGQSTGAATWGGMGSAYSFSVSKIQTEGSPYPHPVVRTVSIPVPEKTSQDTFNSMAMKAWMEKSMPIVKYSVDVEEIADNPDFEAIKLNRFRVGDKGRVIDEYLGIDVILKVTETVKDGVRGKTKTVKFEGEVEATRPAKIPNTADISKLDFI